MKKDNDIKEKIEKKGLLCFATFRQKNKDWIDSTGLYNLPIFDDSIVAREICHKINYIALFQKKGKGGAKFYKIYCAKFRCEVSREELLKLDYPRGGKAHAKRYFLFDVQVVDENSSDLVSHLLAAGTPRVVFLKDFVPEEKFAKIYETLAAGTPIKSVIPELKNALPYVEFDAPVAFVAEAIQMSFWNNLFENVTIEKFDESCKDSVKHGGQVFTPNFLVKKILNYVGYDSKQILSKHIIDNSAGEGAFLCEIVERYCNEFLKSRGNTDGLKNALEKFVHGIEIDSRTYKNCLKNLDGIAKKFGLIKVNWDVICGNALEIADFEGKMDFVVGNPPYVRVHNLNNNYDTVKSFHFAQDGMTDLYLVFYELGLKMLNSSGKLAYITASSWFSSLAATNMRHFIMKEKTLSELIDLGHFQAFEGATTYTAIALFDNSQRHQKINYYTLSSESDERKFIDGLPYEEVSIDGSFYFAPRKSLAMLREIKTKKISNLAQVKNGFATLADDVFIKNVSFKTMTIPVLKASTGKWQRGFFPYDRNGKPLARSEIFSHAEIAEYLENYKKDLLKKCSEEQNPTWFLYGRTQALKDVFCEKYSINAIVKDIASIKLISVPAGSGLYSGLYIRTNVPFETLEKIIKSEDFIDYLKMLKNYKSGGYYTFRSKDLEQFINYKLSNYEKTNDFVSIKKYDFFEGN